MDLAEFEALLTRAISTAHVRLEVGLEKVGQLAEPIAAELPGHYQPGWSPLKASTLEDKKAKGFPVPSPLKRTGNMAASYRKEVDTSTLTLIIGSPELKALWQEMGTSRGIPPRPVLKPALERALPFAADVFGQIAVSMLTGKAVFK